MISSGVIPSCSDRDHRGLFHYYEVPTNTRQGAGQYCKEGDGVIHGEVLGYMAETQVVFSV